jgi:hypothetical protein
MHLTRYFWKARLAWGVLLGVLVSFGSSSSARAECGDYVLMGSKSSDRMMSGMGHQGSHSPLTPGDQHTRCRGPHCSKGSLPLAPTPVVPAPEKSVQSGCLPVVAASGGPEASDLFYWEDNPEPVHFSLSIYHPPR